MGGFSPSSDSGSADAPNTSRSRVTKTRGEGGLIDFIARGGITGAVIRGVTKSVKKNKLDKSLIGTPDYQGTTSKSNIKTDRDGTDNRNDKPQGIELAKASTTSATILGPAEIQKEAANNISGPTSTEMSADQITLANKRKGRRSTNITAKKTLANNYTLSKKTLLG